VTAYASASVAVYGLSADGIRWRTEDHPELAGHVYLEIVPGEVWLTLGRPASNLPEEAAALRKLAEVATEAAAELEQRAKDGAR
jgi:hypothetical protein